MEQHPRTRLIVLDTLEKVRSRPPTNSSTSVYQADYEALEQLSAWAGAHHVAVVVVHHLRKAASLEGDPLDEVSGSTGLTGAADNVIVMRRSPQGVTTLHRQGRDYDDDDVWTLVGDRAQLLWTLDPTAEGSGTGLQQMGEGVKRVVDLLRASEPAGLLSKEVCAACPKSDTAVVRMWLRRAVEHGLASQERVRGAYHVGPAALSAPPPASALSPGLSAVAARAPKEPPPRGSAQGVTSVTSVTSAATLAAPCSDVTPAPPECNTPLVPGVTSLEPLPAWAEDPNVTHVTDVTPSEQERWRNEAERGQDGVPDVTPPAVGCYIPSPPPPSSLTLVEVARQGTEDRAAYVDRLAALGVTEDDAEHFFLSPFFAERVTTRWRGERERALAAAAGGPGERADLGGGVERPAGDARVHAGAPQQHDREAGRHGDD
jgi:hypothetical protein